MKNLSISGKLFLTFLIIILFIVLLGYISIRGTNILDRAFDQIRFGTMPGTRALSNMQKSLKSLKTHQEKFIFNEILLTEQKSKNSLCSQCHSQFDVSKDQNLLIQSIENELNNLDENQAIFEKLPKDDSGAVKLWGIFISDFQDLKKPLNEFLLLMKDSKIGSLDKHQQLHAISQELDINQSKIEKSIGDLVLFDQNQSNEVIESSHQTISSVKTSTILISIGIVILVLIMGFFITIKTIKQPIMDLVHGIEKSKSGDLTYMIPVKTSDEIGKVASYVNELTNSSHKNISEFLIIIDQVNNASRKLYDMLNSLDIEIKKFVIEIGHTSDSIQLVTNNINTLATSTEEMSASIKEIAKNALNASHVSNDSNTKAKSAVELVTKLWERSHEIGNIIKVITNITEQTNLLALNATIEAARAGESGKGFAVVATEVKELAKSTVKSTESITKLISDIQEEITRTSDSMREIMEYAQTISEVDNSISAAVEEQTVTTSEISRNISDTSKGADLIAVTVNSVTTNASKYSSMIKELEQESLKLHDMARELANHFRNTYRL